MDFCQASSGKLSDGCEIDSSTNTQRKVGPRYMIGNAPPLKSPVPYYPPACNHIDRKIIYRPLNLSALTHYWVPGSLSVQLRQGTKHLLLTTRRMILLSCNPNHCWVLLPSPDIDQVPRTCSRSALSAVHSAVDEHADILNAVRPSPIICLPLSIMP